MQSRGGTFIIFEDIISYDRETKDMILYPIDPSYSMTDP
jgi:hypothetical protein